MIAPSSDDELCQRIRASIHRVAEIENFSCVQEGEKLILRGHVHSRDEALMCSVVARMVPGVQTVVSQVKVIS